MTDKIDGYLEVGCNDQNEVVINHSDLTPDENGIGHIVFSVNQARNLAHILLKQADLAAAAIRAKEPPLPPPSPVDYSARTLTDGSPVTEDHREIEPDTGMQKAYVVLSAEERAKGFVRPVRHTYTHVGKMTDMVNDANRYEWKQRIGGCNTDTTMGQALAETYARCPDFYSGTYCVFCRTHKPLDEFVWRGTQEQVGS